MVIAHPKDRPARIPAVAYSAGKLAEAERIAALYGRRTVISRIWRDGQWHVVCLGSGTHPYRALIEQRAERIGVLFGRMSAACLAAVRRAVERPNP